MNNLVVSQVINQLRYFRMQRNAMNAMGLETYEFETIERDLSTIKGLFLPAVLAKSEATTWTAGWVKSAVGVAYKIADMLDELSMMTVKPESVDERSLLKKVWSFTPSPSCSSSTSFHPRESSHFASKIRKLTSQYSLELRELLEEAGTVNYIHNLPTDKETDSLSSPKNVTSRETDYLPSLNVFGRENDEITLLKNLLADTSKQVEVISIVGFFGIGKTTLAKFLYNDDSVRQHFHVQLWACVSNAFDEAGIAAELLFSLGIEKSKKVKFEHLGEYFSEKRVLLVLDDVWTDDVSKWDSVKNSFRNSSPGSKILVTTRSERVANAACSGFVHSLRPLSNSDCWLILKAGLWRGNTDIPKDMVKIGKKIAKNFKGSPLTANVVGSMMMMRTNTPQEWQKVLDTGIWKMEEVAESLFTQFYMTYEALSPESRLCFWDCAVFRRDHVINVNLLIRLWMAQGHFGYQPDDKVIEAKSMRCFNELTNHFLLQDLVKDSIHKDQITSCKIEGAAHEFIISMVSGDYEDKKLRSSLSFSDSEVPKDLFTSPRMKHLRSLVLSSCHLEQLPGEAGDLSLLQYLDLSYNPLKELPATIYKLYSLQFLDVCFCYLLLHLPPQIGKVTSLRHLRVNGTTDELHNLPQEFEKLTLIRTLDVVRVGGRYDSNVQKLGGLNQLEDIRLAVHGKVHFPDADLEKKAKMENLELCFVGDGRDPETAKCVEELKPPPNLQMLRIDDYPGLRLPKWILADSLINNLRRLSVRSASNISSFTSLWKLGHLEFLWFYDIPCMKHLGREIFGYPKRVKKDKRTRSYQVSKDDVESSDESDDSEDDEEIGDGDAAFPSLKTLRIEYLQNWKTWEDVDEADEKRVYVMPSLEELIIVDCPKLEEKPHRILRDTPWFKKQHHGQIDDKPSTSRGQAVEIKHHTQLHLMNDQTKGKSSTLKGKTIDIEPVQE